MGISLEAYVIIIQDKERKIASPLGWLGWFFFGKWYCVFVPVYHKPPLNASKLYYKPTALHGVCINTTNSGTTAAAVALMPESSKGLKMWKVNLSQLIHIAVAKYIPSFTHIVIRKIGPFGMNEFTVHWDKADTHTLKVPLIFKDSVFKALEIGVNYAQIFLLPRLLVIKIHNVVYLNFRCQRNHAWVVWLLHHFPISLV